MTYPEMYGFPRADRETMIGYHYVKVPYSTTEGEFVELFDKICEDNPKMRDLVVYVGCITNNPALRNELIRLRELRKGICMVFAAKLMFYCLDNTCNCFWVRCEKYETPTAPPYNERYHHYDDSMPYVFVIKDSEEYKALEAFIPVVYKKEELTEAFAFM